MCGSQDVVRIHITLSTQTWLGLGAGHSGVLSSDVLSNRKLSLTRSCSYLIVDREYSSQLVGTRDSTQLRAEYDNKSKKIVCIDIAQSSLQIL